MAAAHVLLMTSVREGWGLVVSEANACGTPAIVYDVPGLRDSVIHDQTGLIVQPSPSAMADAMIRLWDDRDLYQKLASQARITSRRFTLDGTANAFSQRLNALVTQP